MVIFRCFGLRAGSGCSCGLRPLLEALIASFPFHELPFVGILFPFVFSFQIVFDLSRKHTCQCEKPFAGGGRSDDQDVEMRAVKALVEIDADKGGSRLSWQSIPEAAYHVRVVFVPVSRLLSENRGGWRILRPECRGWNLVILHFLWTILLLFPGRFPQKQA